MRACHQLTTEHNLARFRNFLLGWQPCKWLIIVGDPLQSTLIVHPWPSFHLTNNQQGFSHSPAGSVHKCYCITPKSLFCLHWISSLLMNFVVPVPQRPLGFCGASLEQRISQQNCYKEHVKCWKPTSDKAASATHHQVPAVLSSPGSILRRSSP